MHHATHNHQQSGSMVSCVFDFFSWDRLLCILCECGLGDFDRFDFSGLRVVLDAVWLFPKHLQEVVRERSTVRPGLRARAALAIYWVFLDSVGLKGVSCSKICCLYSCCFCSENVCWYSKSLRKVVTLPFQKFNSFLFDFSHKLGF